MSAEQQPTIWVVAGPNGGGKSSVVGEMIRQSGGDYFNPDEVAQRLLDLQPHLPVQNANQLAWEQGRRLLEDSIAARRSFALETTLGGRTIAELLHRAVDNGLEVKMWYVALSDADRHLERVRARVARGGHDIPEAAVRGRYDRSRANLVVLLPRLAALKVYDNSWEADTDAGRPPQPRLVLHFVGGKVVNQGDIPATPDWAKAIVAAALRVARRRQALRST